MVVMQVKILRYKVAKQIYDISFTNPVHQKAHRVCSFVDIRHALYLREINFYEKNATFVNVFKQKL